MKTKVYNGISGVLKIICILVVGFIIEVAITGIPMSIAAMDMKYRVEIFKFLFLALATAGYIGLLIISVMQIISIFKQINYNVPVMFGIDVLIIIGIALGYTELGLYFQVLDEGGIPLFTCAYCLSIILTLIDAIVLFMEAKNKKLTIFDEMNCAVVIKRVALIVIPVMVFCAGMTVETMIKSNIEQMRTSEALEGSFDSFTMYDLDGNEYTEDMFKGHKLTMINIWGTFCHPCIDEMPELEEISEMYDKADFQLIGITADLYVAGEVDQGQVDEARRIVGVTGVKYPILIPPIEIMRGVIGNVNCFPTTIFVDENGNQVKLVEGARSKEGWISLIEEVRAGEE